ncbi:site-2 protease family protein [Acetivibrio clariflavus]|uniref:site-2 protease family protein n=1 Tax=Acetivibrio clariflavus TaxID=288965 RepID=UPI0031F5C6C9
MGYDKLNTALKKESCCNGLGEISDFAEERFSVIKEVEIVERYQNNKKCFFVKNQITNKFYVFGEIQYRILMALDENRTIHEAIEHLRDSGLNISFEKVEKFKNNLVSIKLLNCNNKNPSPELKRIETQRGETLIQRLLFIKIPIANLDFLIEKISKKISFVFFPAFLILMAAYIICGLSVYIYKFSPWKTVLITDSSSKNVIIVAVLYITTIIGSAFHEMAHALTCKRFGGKVHEIGIVIIYFRPGLYCNISDSYLFKEKKYRVCVSMAGIILDFVLWSTIVLVGYFFDLVGFNVYFLPAFGFYGLVTILLELNPLIKLDGYYALTEIVDIYNLRENSFKYLQNIFLKNKLKKSIGKKEKRVYIGYAIFAAIYSVWLITNTFYLLMKYLILKLSTLGMIIGFIILGLLFGDIVKKILLLILKILKIKGKGVGDLTHDK